MQTFIWCTIDQYCIVIQLIHTNCYSHVCTSSKQNSLYFGLKNYDIYVIPQSYELIWFPFHWLPWRFNGCSAFSGAKTGNVAVLKDNDRFIYYLITKVKYSDKPTYDSLKESLIKMKSHAVKNMVQKVAMPRIGCGLDGLQWNMVAPLIQDVFEDSDIEINVYYL